MKVSLESLIKNDSDLKLLAGNKDLSLNSISSIEEINDEEVLFLGNKKFFKKYQQAKVENKIVIIIDEKLYEELDQEDREYLSNNTLALLTSSNIPISITKASKVFYEKQRGSIAFELDGRKDGSAKIHPSVKIAEGVFIGENVEIESDCFIMPGCVIMPNVKISQGTTLYSNVTIYPETVIGKNCRIHGGTTIGSDGFGYNFHQGVHHKIWHFGGVVIGDDVEIGANSCVDQGTFTPTRIGSGTKIDNHVQVGHNVQLGKGVILCGQVAIGGSTKIGDYAVFGGKSAVADNLEVGMAAQISGGSTVIGNVAAQETVGGYPARPMREFLRSIAFIRKNIKR
ncbi:UDP-3-O-[3-hydroxymyristoyl] [Halobacteriovorax sp. BALOs_7]|uniref:UDP-3-O-(3-hydroxymyristoyl)glucosamine N-acyltransferase n=1 Tax=unclassified Halobacteriovorax TaxID=2639665 RepID=UPI000EA3439D|nr:UDP-3-O-(3-hydroxymyristoyl)glucosamine N-acyltransferase [Halobacteriovorax sp. BALOs_7]AYF43457.1 UDP-3-O-[3-hydroxymyristoyl] [Halobacteriovorax sp. BALOs_7]